MYEPEAGNRSASDRENAPLLVWRALSKWSWESECGRFRIERFVTGDHERIKDEVTFPERYRVLKRSAEWDYEFAPNEIDLLSAKQLCEKFPIE